MIAIVIISFAVGACIGGGAYSIGYHVGRRRARELMYGVAGSAFSEADRDNATSRLRR